MEDEVARTVPVDASHPSAGLPDWDEPSASPPNPLLRLPALGLFRTFDAVVRLRSFRAAASELCVTPSAISQQIRHLEEQLQVRLFRRLPRRIELTREGAGLATATREAIAILAGACRQVGSVSGPTVISVSVAPALATRWLIKQLTRFMQAHPDIRVMLHAANDDIDFRRQDIDLGIRWGGGRWPGCESEPLVADVIVPVCSPDYWRENALDVPDNLQRATQLNVIGQGNQWSDWFAAAGLPPVAFRDILHFSDGVMMLEAAAQGQGICLASTLLVSHDITSGRLIRPYSRTLQLREGYYVLRDRAITPRPAVEAFRKWVIEEAAGSVSGAAVASSGQSSSARRRSGSRP